MIETSQIQRPAADILARSLAGVPEQTAAALCRIGVLRHWSDGETLLRRGDVAAAALLLVRGRLRLTATTSDGAEVLFRWFLPGEFLGLASLLGQKPMSVEAVATGSCEVVHFDGFDLVDHLRRDAEGALHFAGIVSRFAAEITNLLATHTAGTLNERVWSVLCRLAAHELADPSAGDLRLTVSNRDLALAVGASRQRINIELHKLEKSGRIRLGYRHLILVGSGEPPAVADPGPD